MARGQILDVVLIVNKAIDSRLKGSSRRIIYKLGIEKTHNHVNLSFVFAILEKMGVGSKWIRWCISIVHFSVLITGPPSSFFQNFKGLRQGDPLSPYFFILAMETLSHILIRAKKGGFIDGFLVRGRDGVGVRYPICYLWVIPSFFMMLVRRI